MAENRHPLNRGAPGEPSIPDRIPLFEVYMRMAEELVEAARSAGGPWYLLALSEDWCGDAVNALPIIARWAEAVPGMELRILGRDDNPELMDAHLTGGRSRSIPVVMVLDRDFREVGWWGPRPRVLQDWVLGEGRSLRPQERYKRVRSWYARDRGRTVLEELLALLGSTAGGLATPSPEEAPAAPGTAWRRTVTP
ncbi:MAG: thioredoxin family protein [Gemmatimonadota bacterium]